MFDVKIGSVKMKNSTALKLYAEKKYVVTSAGVYQLSTYPVKMSPFISVAGCQIYHQSGMVKRGTWKALAASEVNRVVGFRLVREDL